MLRTCREAFNGIRLKSHLGSGVIFKSGKFALECGNNRHVTQATSGTPYTGATKRLIVREQVAKIPRSYHPETLLLFIFPLEIQDLSP